MTASRDPGSGKLDGDSTVPRLRQAGVSIAVIARVTGHDWKTVKKYLAAGRAGQSAGGAVVGGDPAAEDRRGHGVGDH